MAGSIGDFWSLFGERAAELARAGSADTPVYDLLLEGLQRINPGLYLEFCCDSDGYELIVTAEGNSDLFSLARAVVAMAPVQPGWAFRALKPQIGFPATVRWDDVTIAIASIVFDPLERDGSMDLGLRILIPGLEESDVEGAHNAVLRAIDHGLGEERHAETIQHVEVRAMPPNANASDHIPLVDLAAFVEWRERKRH